jgi:hypothetical protein
VASKHPFYKYNGIWQRDIQNLVRLPSIHTLLDLTLNDEQITSLQIRTWLETKELITIQQIGSLLNGLSEHINSVCNQS